MDYKKLLVLTDTHLVEDGSDIIGLDPAARLKEVLDHALTHHPDAERLVIAGDLSHHGRIEQYERVKDIVQAVEIPVTLMMGNHDRREPFRQVFGGTGFVQEAFDIGDLRCLCLDTLVGPPYPEGHHAGILCQERLDWLDAQLDGAARAMIVMHHPPFSTGLIGMDAINLSNSDAFFEVIQRHGTVEHLICGHVHRTISGHANGMPFTIFKSPCHQSPLRLEETGSSLSVDEPGAYGVVLVARDSIVVHSEDVGLNGEVISDPFSR